MKASHTVKIVVLALVVFGSAIGMAATSQPANTGFAFLIGLLGLELVRVLRSDS